MFVSDAMPGDQPILSVTELRSPVYSLKFALPFVHVPIMAMRNGVRRVSDLLVADDVLREYCDGMTPTERLAQVSERPKLCFLPIMILCVRA